MNSSVNPINIWAGFKLPAKPAGSGTGIPETGPNRSKSNLNLKSSVQTVRTGIPVGLTGNRPNSIFFLF